MTTDKDSLLSYRIKHQRISMCTSRFKASSSLDVRICIHPFQILAWAMSLRTYPSVWVIRIVRSKSFCSISIYRQSVSIEAPCVPVPFFSRGKNYINTFRDYAALCANQCDSEHCNYLTYEEMSLQHMERSIDFGYPQTICRFIFHFSCRNTAPMIKE